MIARPSLGGIGVHQLGAQVLIAAILLPVIRDDGMTLGGACREWPKPKPADDRRGSERIGTGTIPSREAYEPERTVPALDPGGGSRCRPVAEHRGVSRPVKHPDGS